MTSSFGEFMRSIELGEQPASVNAPLTALWQDASGAWEAAHQTVQAEKDAESAWVHAYLHRKEGNLSNARYWYGRAGKPPEDGPLEAEWRSIVVTLLDA